MEEQKLYKPNVLGCIFFPGHMIKSHVYTRRVVSGMPITGGFLFVQQLWILGLKLSVIGIYFYLCMKYSEIVEYREKAFRYGLYAENAVEMKVGE